MKATSVPSLLKTKLHLPRPRIPLVTRPHLIERLQQSVQRPLTLISAPAGFGKTTLLAQWCWENHLPIAWLSLEPEDDDPARFLPYLIAAFQTLNSQLGADALALLGTPQPPPPEMVLALLVNDLMEHQGKDMVLVLDDYHAISSDLLQQGIRFLVEHLPPHVHLIIATRSDPPLPLARLRARGHLAEMRASDLCFTSEETHTFLQTMLGRDLPPEVMTLLERRTEGWVAGLQLAGLSLQGKTDIAGFVTGFTGTHRFVLDYLSEEVLSQQPPSVQTFLLSTSLLDRLSGPLCDAVTAQQGSQDILEMLEKANLFVVALDETRGWYRYHHLFGEALRNSLQRREPAMIPTLHRRASDWYEQHGLPFEAIQHALAIPDEERVIRLIEPIVIPFAFRGQRSTVLKWLNALSEDMMRAHPLLGVYYASLLMFTNQFEATEVRLLEAEQGIREEEPWQARIIKGYVLTNRASITGFTGESEQSISLAHQALDLLPETENIARSGATILAAHRFQVDGNVTPPAEHALATAVALIRTLHNPFATVGGIALLAKLHALQGHLQQATSTYAQIVQVVSSSEMLQMMYAGPYYYFGLGDVLREWNDLEAAERHLRQGIMLIHEEVPLEAWVLIQGYTALASLLQAQGRASEAHATLKALEQLARQRHFAACRQAQIAAAKARIELAQGNLEAAVHWAASCKLSLSDTDIPYSREGEYLTLARVSIAQRKQSSRKQDLQEVLGLLEALLTEAEAKGRLGSIIEILIVCALALATQGDQAAALSTLKQALLLAEPEGYVRLFVDEGPPIHSLLRRVQVHTTASEYVTTLLNAFGDPQDPRVPTHTGNAEPLAALLTEREREIVGLLLEGASNGEIASRLVLSVNTVKRHVYNICGKLGVQNRLQVIARARSLNLV
ncbi:MAG: hypothetical protein J2P37_07885 [Ktedonobacteraceae bacterium]|nr:hypothetical protein [Ktedonobacteraceae bacterium]